MAEVFSTSSYSANHDTQVLQSFRLPTLEWCGVCVANEAANARDRRGGVHSTVSACRLQVAAVAGVSKKAAARQAPIAVITAAITKIAQYPKAVTMYPPVKAIANMIAPMHIT